MLTNYQIFFGVIAILIALFVMLVVTAKHPDSFWDNTPAEQSIYLVCFWVIAMCCAALVLHFIVWMYDLIAGNGWLL